MKNAPALDDSVNRAEQLLRDALLHNGPPDKVNEELMTRIDELLQLEVDGLRVRVQRNDGWADWYDVAEVQVIS